MWLDELKKERDVFDKKKANGTKKENLTQS
jgi:hypothetical protein